MYLKKSLDQIPVGVTSGCESNTTCSEVDNNFQVGRTATHNETTLSENNFKDKNLNEHTENQTMMNNEAKSLTKTRISVENESLKMTESKIVVCQKLSISCEICGEKFEHELLKEIHMKACHVIDELLLCPQCNENVEFSKWRRHQKQHKDDLTAKPYCEKCKKYYKSARNLGDHIREVHNKGKNYICPIATCRKVFKRQRNLNVHMERHAGKLNHLCQCCGQGYTTRTALIKHIQTKHSHDKDADKEESVKLTVSKAEIVTSSENAVSSERAAADELITADGTTTTAPHITQRNDSLLQYLGGVSFQTAEKLEAETAAEEFLVNGDAMVKESVISDGMPHASTRREDSLIQYLTSGSFQSDMINDQLVESDDHLVSSEANERSTQRADSLLQYLNGDFGQSSALGLLLRSDSNAPFTPDNNLPVSQSANMPLAQMGNIHNSQVENTPVNQSGNILPHQDGNLLMNQNHNMSMIQNGNIPVIQGGNVPVILHNNDYTMVQNSNIPRLPVMQSDIMSSVRGGDRVLVQSAHAPVLQNDNIMTTQVSNMPVNLCNQTLMTQSEDTKFLESGDINNSKQASIDGTKRADSLQLYLESQAALTSQSVDHSSRKHYQNLEASTPSREDSLTTYLAEASRLLQADEDSKSLSHMTKRPKLHRDSHVLSFNIPPPPLDSQQMEKSRPVTLSNTQTTQNSANMFLVNKPANLYMKPTYSEDMKAVLEDIGLVEFPTETSKKSTFTPGDVNSQVVKLQSGTNEIADNS
ncbi:hypothetical protein EB796_016054 [Bugula neritina]|uniref:C2H2-type domain-containing protein n=1 Tax=Bugula neritina TaxID=10212 RepID=A0A7J7JJ08_BUGNE|nr:hypothetical protein EB796_016054 [Bugula neritina]